MKKPRTRGHDALWISGVLLLLAGIGVLVAGVYFFGSAATTPVGDFHADPEGTIDRTRNAAFLGIGLIGLGGLVAPVGAVMSLVAAILEVYRSPRVAT